MRPPVVVWALQYTSMYSHFCTVTCLLCDTLPKRVDQYKEIKDVEHTEDLDSLQNNWDILPRDGW